MSKINVDTWEPEGSGTTITAGASGDTLVISADSVTGLNVGSDAAGDILYNDGTDYTRLAKPGTPADEVLTFATGATAPSWVAPASATLAPAFSACANADVTISDATDTKVTLNREVFDSNSAFDPTTNYRFTVPAGEGGKYLIAAGVSFGSTSDMEVVRVHIKKGGSTISSNEWSSAAGYVAYWGLLSLTLTCVLDLSATNYVELFGYLDSSSGTRTIKGDSTIQESWMSGFKLVGI